MTPPIPLQFEKGGDMTDNILQQFWFYGYGLDMPIAEVVRQFGARYHSYPALIIAPLGHCQSPAIMDCLSELQIQYDNNADAHGMIYAGPVPTEVVDDEA